jgi:voltage-gated potassium channel
MRALRSSFGRSGFNYVVALTAIVLFVGAAGMFAFENQTGAGQGLHNYGDALWYTAMLLTTIGSGYSPVTGAGRLLTLILSLYAFAVFSYITATLASFFVGEAASAPDSNVASEASIKSLREEIAALRQELQSASRDPDQSEPHQERKDQAAQ